MIMRRTAMLLLCVSIAGAGIFAGLRLERPGEAEATKSTAAPPRMVVRPTERTVNATGTVRLRVGSEVRVGSQLSGIVRKLYVTVGSHVKKGNVIAEIDDRTLQARLAQADAQAAYDRASLEKANVSYARAARMLAAGLIPEQQADDLRLAAAEANGKYVKSLRDRDAVEIDLSYVAIRAPISGTVATVATQEGETVAASFTAPTFVTVIADGALQVVAMVDETDIARVHAGDPVTFTVDAYPAREFQGIVSQIAPRGTIVSGVVNYEVTVQIASGADALKPDMTTNVLISNGARP
jgi:RND family efflux transporter MFP subunit